MEAAARTGQDVVVPTLVLAELYRGAGRSHLVDALLARHRRRSDAVTPTASLLGSSDRYSTPRASDPNTLSMLTL
jgi:hypothetical protein